MKDQIARPAHRLSRLRSMSAVETVMVYVTKVVRSQKTHGLAYSQQREASKSCISGHTAAVKLHNQGKS